MAGEPKSIGKALPAGGALQTVLEAGNGEYIQINHIRVTSGDDAAKVTAKISESGGSINIWNKKLVKANNSEDIYVQSLDPGESLKVGADVTGVHLVVQYESNLSSSGSSTPSWMKKQFALAMAGWVDSQYYATSDSTEKYEFATDVSMSWNSLLNIRELGTAFSDGVKAFAMGGYTNGDYRTANISPNDKHIFATLVTTASTNLPYYVTDLPAGVNNQVDGFIIGGRTQVSSSQVTRNTYKFNFAAETFIAGGLLEVARGYAAAAGNTEVAVVAGGRNDGYSKLQSCEKLDYASVTYTAATSLAQATSLIAATGHQDFGLFASGYPASGNVSQAILKYTYSVNTFVTLGATLTHAHGAGVAASNAETGLFLGGEDEISGSISTYVDKYDFATSVIVSGSNMSKARGYGGAASSAPGHF